MIPGGCALVLLGLILRWLDEGRMDTGLVTATLLTQLIGLGLIIWGVLR